MSLTPLDKASDVAASLPEAPAASQNASPFTPSLPDDWDTSPPLSEPTNWGGSQETSPGKKAEGASEIASGAKANTRVNPNVAFKTPPHASEKNQIQRPRTLSEPTIRLHDSRTEAQQVRSRTLSAPLASTVKDARIEAVVARASESSILAKTEISWKQQVARSFGWVLVGLGAVSSFIPKVLSKGNPSEIAHVQHWFINVITTPTTALADWVCSLFGKAGIWCLEIGGKNADEEGRDTINALKNFFDTKFDSYHSWHKFRTKGARIEDNNSPQKPGEPSPSEKATSAAKPPSSKVESIEEEHIREIDKMDDDDIQVRVAQKYSGENDEEHFGKIYKMDDDDIEEPKIIPDTPHEPEPPLDTQT